MCATEAQVCGFYIPQFFFGLLHEVQLLYVVDVEACGHKLNTRSAMSFTDDVCIIKCKVLYYRL
jgi:hypothetical protein